MKHVDEDMIEMGKYYLMYFNRGKQSKAHSKVMYIGKALKLDRDFKSLTMIAYFAYNTHYNEVLKGCKEIEIFYLTTDASVKTSVFELTDDEVLMHIVREQL